MNAAMYVEPCPHPFSITIPLHMYVSPMQLPTTPRAFSPRGTLGPLPEQARRAGTLSSGAVPNHGWLGAGGQIAQPNHLLMRTNRSPFYPSPEPHPLPRSLLQPAHPHALKCTVFLPWPTSPLPTSASWDHHPRERLLPRLSPLLGEPNSGKIINTQNHLFYVHGDLHSEIPTAPGRSPQQPQETGNGD